MLLRNKEEGHKLNRGGRGLSENDNIKNEYVGVCLYKEYI